MNQTQRESIQRMIADDFKTINEALKKQLQSAWEATAKTVAAENHLVDPRLRMKKLESELEELEIERVEFEQRHEQKVQAVKDKMANLKKESLGELAKPADAKIIVQLGIDEDTETRYYRSKGDRKIYKWHDIRIENQLDALTAERMSKTVNVVPVYRMVKDIENAIHIAMRFASTLEEMRDIYKRFRAFNFRAMGVDLPPTLEEVCNNPQYTQLATKKPSAPSKKALPKKSTTRRAEA